MQIKSQRDTRYLEFAGKLIEELFSACDIYADPNDDKWREKWQGVIAQRVYDLATPAEYIDSMTRVHMTVEHDNPGYPGHPKITIICPEHHQLTFEQVNAAINRLYTSAGLPKPPPYVQIPPNDQQE